MGMFDYIHCRYPLPDGFVGDLEYQTKDTPEQFLEHYTITEDGRLIHHYVAREWRDDATRPLLKGYFAPIESSREDREVPFHGDLEFYTSNVSMSGPEGLATEDDSPPFYRSYTARFTNGRVEWIRGGLEAEAFAGRPHLPRARLHELWREKEGQKDGGLRVLNPGAFLAPEKNEPVVTDGGHGADGGGVGGE